MKQKVVLTTSTHLLLRDNPTSYPKPTALSFHSAAERGKYQTGREKGNPLCPSIFSLLKHSQPILHSGGSTPHHLLWILKKQGENSFLSKHLDYSSFSSRYQHLRLGYIKWKQKSIWRLPMLDGGPSHAVDVCFASHCSTGTANPI